MSFDRMLNKDWARYENGGFGSDRIEKGYQRTVGNVQLVDDNGDFIVDDNGDRIVCNSAASLAAAGVSTTFAWGEVRPAIKSETVVFDAGCEMLIGEPPAEDDTATAADPAPGPFTKIVTKAGGGDAMAKRLAYTP